MAEIDKRVLSRPDIPPLNTAGLDFADEYQYSSQRSCDPGHNPSLVVDSYLGEQKSDPSRANTASPSKDGDFCREETVSDQISSADFCDGDMVSEKTNDCLGSVPSPLPSPPSSSTAAEGVFVPKFENISARERKLRAFRGQNYPILHDCDVPVREEPPALYPLSKMIQSQRGSIETTSNVGGQRNCTEFKQWDTASQVSANERKRSEQESNIFWDNWSETSKSKTECSSTLPTQFEDEESLEAQERRRTETNYSDLFGRATPKGRKGRRHKDKEPPVACSPNSTARERYIHEMGSQLAGGPRSYEVLDNPTPTDDKERTRNRRNAHEIGHKAASLLHCQSLALAPPEEKRKFMDYEVKFQNLNADTTDEDLKQLARQCGCFMSRVSVDWDPIASRCKGGGRGILKVEDGSTQMPHFKKAVLKMGASVKMVEA